MNKQRSMTNKLEMRQQMLKISFIILVATITSTVCTEESDTEGVFEAKRLQHENYHLSRRLNISSANLPYNTVELYGQVEEPPVPDIAAAQQQEPLEIAESESTDEAIPVVTDPYYVYYNDYGNEYTDYYNFDVDNDNIEEDIASFYTDVPEEGGEKISRLPEVLPLTSVQGEEGEEIEMLPTPSALAQPDADPGLIDDVASALKSAFVGKTEEGGESEGDERLINGKSVTLGSIANRPVLFLEGSGNKNISFASSQAEALAALGNSALFLASLVGLGNIPRTFFSRRLGITKKSGKSTNPYLTPPLTKRIAKPWPRKRLTQERSRVKPWNKYEDTFDSYGQGRNFNSDFSYPRSRLTPSRRTYQSKDRSFSVRESLVKPRPPQRRRIRPFSKGLRDGLTGGSTYERNFQAKRPILRSNPEDLVYETKTKIPNRYEDSFNDVDDIESPFKNAFYQEKKPLQVHPLEINITPYKTAQKGQSRPQSNFKSSNLNRPYLFKEPFVGNKKSQKSAASNDFIRDLYQYDDDYNYNDDPYDAFIGYSQPTQSSTLDQIKTFQTFPALETPSPTRSYDSFTTPKDRVVHGDRYVPLEVQPHPVKLTRDSKEQNDIPNKEADFDFKRRRPVNNKDTKKKTLKKKLVKRRKNKPVYLGDLADYYDSDNQNIGRNPADSYTQNRNTFQEEPRGVQQQQGGPSFNSAGFGFESTDWMKGFDSNFPSFQSFNDFKKLSSK